MNVPLSLHIVNVLSDMPRHASGKVFPLSNNAVDMAWDGVRIKAGLPTLQFKDIRHLGATAYARRGLNAHQLKAILGHKTLYMAQVYVNLVAHDVLNAMDATAPVVPVIQVPPPAAGTAEDIIKARRSSRLADAVSNRLQSKASDGSEVVKAPAGTNTSSVARTEEPLVTPTASATVPRVEDATAMFVKAAMLDAQTLVPPAAVSPTEVGTPSPTPTVDKLEPASIAEPAPVAANVLMFRPRQRAA